MRHFCRYFFILILAWQINVFASISYSVEYKGLKDASALKAIKGTSQLTALKKHAPASINALRYRAESDIPDILKILHAHGYYEASVDVRVEETLKKVNVIVSIQAGPVYKLEDYQIKLYCNAPNEETCCDRVSLEKIGIVLGCPAVGQKILSAELKLLEILGECGHPLAEIDHREVIADGITKGIRISLSVKTGPLTRFGPLTIQGLREIKELYVLQKLTWREGEIYDSRLVESTQRMLMNSGLFSSVVITHSPDLDAEGLIQMKLEVVESKHKNINVGISYQTVFGPGITFGIENRDMGGMGRRLSFQGDVTRISQTGTATYYVSDFRQVGQDLVGQAIAMRENLFAYNDRSYSVTGRLDKKLTRQLRFSGGVRAERLLVTDSVDNGNFTLIEVPLYVRWSSANSLLNPTRGATLEYSAAPSVNISQISQYYLAQEISQSTYIPLMKNEFLVFAQQITFGMILSNGLNAVPIPKRFLGGSEQELRGYRYRTVSPLVCCLPEGGRSAIYYTAETRFRLSQSIGVVPFFDIGNVYSQQFPNLSGKWFKSVGLGLRYFSFIGPLRLDVAFPLNRRKCIDPFYRFLVSIGQTF
jgi:translocation and assembly module TamA